MSQGHVPASECLERVRSAARNGDGNALLAAARDALGRHAADVRMLIDVGIALRDRGLYAEADRFFDHISFVDRAVAYGHYEAAISCMLQGRHVDALHHSLEALARAPDDNRSRLLVARMAAATGDGQRASALLGEMARSPHDAPADWWPDFFRFARDFPAAEGLRRAVHLAHRRDHLDAANLAARIEAAVDGRQPFSMVRLGDGEGAFLRLSDADEARYPALYRQNRLDRSHVWFAGRLDIYASGFVEEMRGLEAAIARADVVGVPYPTWVRHEYDIASPTGVSSLVNALRFVDQMAAAPGRSYAAQNVHTELLNEGHLGRLLSRAGSVTVISGHHSLPDALRRRFGLRAVRFLDIPTEQANAHLMPSALTAGPHYPDHFRRTLGRIAALGDPGLTLVGGGILGKFYCDAVKAAGGVAVDIGSVADAWAGVGTRPGMRREDALV